jgi:hypothetical protein
VDPRRGLADRYWGRRRGDPARSDTARRGPARGDRPREPLSGRPGQERVGTPPAMLACLEGDLHAQSAIRSTAVPPPRCRETPVEFCPLTDEQFGTLPAKGRSVRLSLTLGRSQVRPTGTLDLKSVTAKELKPNATPGWPKTKGVRVVTVNEPDSGDYLQGEVTKRTRAATPRPCATSTTIRPLLPLSSRPSCPATAARAFARSVVPPGAASVWSLPLPVQVAARLRSQQPSAPPAR